VEKVSTKTETAKDRSVDSFVREWTRCGQKRSHVLHLLDQNKSLNSLTNIRNNNVTKWVSVGDI
jgi:hypothetical protein